MSRSRRYATEAPPFDLLSKAIADDDTTIDIKDLVFMWRIRNPRAARIMQLRHTWSTVDGRAWATVKRLVLAHAHAIREKRGLSVLILDSSGNTVESA